MNGRLGKAKFHSLRILLDSGEMSFIAIGKHTQFFNFFNTTPVKWITQGGDLEKTTILDATKIVMWKFHMYDSQGNARYDIILGQDVLSRLKIDL